MGQAPSSSASSRERRGGGGPPPPHRAQGRRRRPPRRPLVDRAGARGGEGGAHGGVERRPGKNCSGWASLSSKSTSKEVHECAWKRSTRPSCGGGNGRRLPFRSRSSAPWGRSR